MLAMPALEALSPFDKTILEKILKRKATLSMMRDETVTRVPYQRCHSMKPTKFLSILLVMMTITAGTSAQTLDRGEIHGTVRDQSGAVLQDVSVTLRNLNTGLE